MHNGNSDIDNKNNESHAGFYMVFITIISSIIIVCALFRRRADPVGEHLDRVVPEVGALRANPEPQPIPPRRPSTISTISTVSTAIPTSEEVYVRP
ncbi:hypothetical protein N8772_03040 [Rickettsiales bacterium]|nr:hypothetical protein [Rickettsiales bacterium]MDB2550800.1 hypothetical protein [Rickettsiales bacterium]